MTADGFLARKKIDDPDFGGNLRLLYKKQDNNCEHRISSISIAITTTNETSATTVIATNVLVLVIPPSSRP